MSSAIDDALAAQIKAQGSGYVRVEGGHLFAFTVKTLERLLARALESGGTARVLVKNGGEA